MFIRSDLHASCTFTAFDIRLMDWKCAVSLNLGKMTVHDAHSVEVGSTAITSIPSLSSALQTSALLGHRNMVLIKWSLY